MRFAFLTMDRTEGWSIDSHLCFEPLRALGWQPEWVSWRARVDWNGFAAAYLAATWDYPEDPAAFHAALERIDASRAVLVNDLRLVRWNLDKHYLRELRDRGIPIVPTSFHPRLDDAAREAIRRAANDGRFVVKPVVGANSRDTFLLEGPPSAADWSTLERIYAGQGLLVQPFLDAVRSEGETSLFYFDGERAHTVRKVPKPGDFRVQEEHGGSIRLAEATPAQIEVGAAVLAAIGVVPAYARVDLVDDANGEPRLMELEMVEPSLYLRKDAAAPPRLARALDRAVRSASCEGRGASGS